MSVNSCQRVRSRSTARRASGPVGERGGGIAMAQPTASPATRRTRALLRSLRAFTLHPPHLGPQVVQLLLDAIGRGVELPGLLPGGGSVLVEAVLEVRVTEVLEDDRVFLGLVHRLLQLAERVGEFP